MTQPLESRRKALVIYNPVAGHRRRLIVVAFAEGLRQRGFEVQLVETLKTGDAETIARTAQHNEFDVAIAAGGDGTVNEVINGLCGSRVPLAILPVGTANVLAAELGIKFNPALLLDAIGQGYVEEIWLAEAGNRYFSMMLGVGFDASVIARVERSHSSYFSKSRLGKGAYIVAACKQLSTSRFVDFAVELDGMAYSATSLIIANGHYYAGRFITAREARLDEPLLYACLCQGNTRTQMIRTAAALAFGRFHCAPGIKIVRARQITVRGPQTEAFHCDGDLFGNLPISITAGAAKISVILPRRTVELPQRKEQ